MNLVRDFIKALQAERKATSPYDTTATVVRVDGKTAWVHISGGVDETPVRMTVNAEVGDEVQVRVGGGKAWITGNATAPPTDDKTALLARIEGIEAKQKAREATAKADVANDKADTATQYASDALDAASGSLVTDTLHYLATSLSSGVTIHTAGWTTTPQTISENNPYLWTYHTYTKASGTQTNTTPVIIGTYGKDGTSVTILGSYNTLAELQTAHPTGSVGDAYMVGGDLYTWNGSAWENVGQIQGPQGPQGTSITVTNIRYAVSTTESQPADSAFTYSSVPTVAEGSWLWTRTLYSDGSKVYTKAKQGAKGTDAVTKYTWVKYADTPTSGMSDNPSGKDYIGFAYNKDTPTESTTYSDYTWSLIKGEKGDTGDDGISITAVQPQYYLSTSDQRATGGSWGTSITYQTGLYIWTRDQISYSNNTTGYSTAIYNQALTQACSDAMQALEVAQEVNQYTWHTETDTGTGAGTHLTSVPQDEFETNPSGFNSLLNSVGMMIRNGLSTLAQYGKNIFLMNNGNLAFSVEQGTRNEIVSRREILGTEIGVGSSFTFNGDTTVTLSSGGQFVILWGGQPPWGSNVFTIGTASTTTNSYGVTCAYDGANSVTVTNGYSQPIIVDTIWYNIIADVALVQVHGDLLTEVYTSDNITLNGIIHPVSDVYNDGLLNIKKTIGKLLGIWKAPTFSTSGLSPVSSRCTIAAGGFIDVGYFRYVQLALTIKASLSANNYWGILDGIGTTNQNNKPQPALAASIAGKKGGAVSAYLNESGRLVVETDNAALANGDVLLVTGWCYVDRNSSTVNPII